LLLKIGICWHRVCGARRDGRKEMQKEGRERAHDVRATVYMGRIGDRISNLRIKIQKHFRAHRENKGRAKG
jgi:hypothetical protein